MTVFDQTNSEMYHVNQTCSEIDIIDIRSTVYIFLERSSPSFAYRGKERNVVSVSMTVSIVTQSTIV